MKLTPALLIAALTTGAALAEDRAALEKALVANEEKAIEAIVKGDAAGFTRLLAPDALSSDASGIVPASEFAKVIPQMKISESKLNGPRFVWADDTTAVLTYTWTGKGTMMGQPVPSPTYASTVWAKRGAEWLAVFHQETTAAPAPAAK